MSSEKKMDKKMKKAILNCDLKTFEELFDDIYSSNDDAKMVYVFITKYAKYHSAGLDPFYGNDDLFKKMPQSLLYELILNHKTQCFTRCIFKALNEDNKVKYLNTIISFNDFKGRIYDLDYNTINKYITKEYIDKLIEYDKDKYYTNRLLSLLKYYYPEDEELKKYILDYLIKEHGKKIIINIIRDYQEIKGGKAIINLVKDSIISPRPNYDKELDNDYYNSNYYYKDISDKNIFHNDNVNYIVSYNIIKEYVSRYKEIKTLIHGLDFVLDTNDNNLFTYYYLLNYKNLPIPDKYKLSVICKKCNYNNKKEFKEFLDYYISYYKGTIVDIKPILKHRYDLCDIDGFEFNDLFKIGDIDDILLVIKDNISKLKEAIASPLYLSQKTSVKQSNKAARLQIIFKNTIKMADAIKDRVDVHDYIDELYDILKASNYFYNNNLNVLYMAENTVCLSDRICNDIVSFILGDGNEANTNRIIYLKDKIKNIRSLDEESLIKLTSELLKTKDYDLILSFLENTAWHSNIQVLEDMIVNTNDLNIIAEYIYLTKDRDLLKKKFVDKDKYLNYCVDNNIRKKYEINKVF